MSSLSQTQPELQPFTPTHLICLDELDATEKEMYYDLLISADVHMHRNTNGSGEIYADVRVLGPGVKLGNNQNDKTSSFDNSNQNPLGQSDNSKNNTVAGRLTPREKLALQAASVRLPGNMTCMTSHDTSFDYSSYSQIAKLLLPSNGTAFTYKPKRRPLSWVMRLIHEVYDVRYARDTANMTADDMGKEESSRAQYNAELEKSFPIFIVDLFSKKYGLKSLVDSTLWDLLLSIDLLRIDYENNSDVEIFARFIEMKYDSDELLYYCYVRSLTQSVLNTHFKVHWAGPLNDPSSIGIDRRNTRECTYIARRYLF